MLKLIFSDLDDTLLDSKKMVSKKTMNFIKGLKDTCFIVNSGRLPYNMDPIKQYIDPVEINESSSVGEQIKYYRQLMGI